MGMECVKKGFDFPLSSSLLRSASIQGSSQFRDLGQLARSNSHSVVRRGDDTKIPLAAGRLEGTRPFFVTAC
jgi:hypothetical protein